MCCYIPGHHGLSKTHQWNKQWDILLCTHTINYLGLYRLIATSQIGCDNLSDKRSTEWDAIVSLHLSLMQIQFAPIVRRTRIEYIFQKRSEIQNILENSLESWLLHANMPMWFSCQQHIKSLLLSSFMMFLQLPSMTCGPGIAFNKITSFIWLIRISHN